MKSKTENRSRYGRTVNALDRGVMDGARKKSRNQGI